MGWTVDFGEVSFGRAGAPEEKPDYVLVRQRHTGGPQGLRSRPYRPMDRREDSLGWFTLACRRSEGHGLAMRVCAHNLGGCSRDIAADAGKVFRARSSFECCSSRTLRDRSSL